MIDSWRVSLEVLDGDLQNLFFLYYFLVFTLLWADVVGLVHGDRPEECSIFNKILRNQCVKLIAR